MGLTLLLVAVAALGELRLVRNREREAAPGRADGADDGDDGGQPAGRPGRKVRR
ncbi:hypothetical protein [Streptomyces roseolus]|uniref:hypothetical protein n=1 Tax=Streptomyces roseolus TaxID=67358 RepID=UPI00167B5182|nr:hypothetical protein [Streptomyces roseolus]GGR40062.1 hypothetical protein GCM10010282_35980 [Streptomyces roseolus]